MLRAADAEHIAMAGGFVAQNALDNIRAKTGAQIMDHGTVATNAVILENFAVSGFYHYGFMKILQSKCL